MAPPTCSIRTASVADMRAIARHRSGMFRDMGRLDPAAIPVLETTTENWLREAMPRGEYLGWLAFPDDEPQTIVAGAGVQVRRVLPFPLHDTRPTEVAEGRQAIVVNVFTEPAWRRRGLARALMEAIIAWARAERLDSLVLHASPDGRPLYERLGFAQTNEMRFQDRLDRPPARGSGTR